MKNNKVVTFTEEELEIMKEASEDLKVELLKDLSTDEYLISMDDYYSHGSRYGNKNDLTLLVLRELVHLISIGEASIVDKEKEIYNYQQMKRIKKNIVNIRVLDIENGYHYFIDGKYDFVELKKISKTTCKCEGLIQSLSRLKPTLQSKFTKYAKLNKDLGNCLSKMRKYSDINKADDFDTEMTKYLSKEQRLRKINSVLG